MPEIVLALYVVDRIYEANGVTETRVTSGLDGTHMKDSPHYIGRAIDIRTHNIPDASKKSLIRLAIQEALGPEFTLLFEDEGGANEHFHLQSAKGGPSEKAP